MNEERNDEGGEAGVQSPETLKGREVEHTEKYCEARKGSKNGRGDDDDLKSDERRREEEGETREGILGQYYMWLYQVDGGPSCSRPGEGDQGSRSPGSRVPHVLGPGPYPDSGDGLGHGKGKGGRGGEEREESRKGKNRRKEEKKKRRKEEKKKRRKEEKKKRRKEEKTRRKKKKRKGKGLTMRGTMALAIASHSIISISPCRAWHTQPWNLMSSDKPETSNTRKGHIRRRLACRGMEELLARQARGPDYAANLHLSCSSNTDCSRRNRDVDDAQERISPTDEL